MKAAAFHQPGPPHVLTTIELPTPSPGPGQVLVKTAAATVNAADVLVRRGQAGPEAYRSGGHTVPGLEASGRVVEVGPGVTGIEPDSPVLVWGEACYAEFIIAPKERVTPLSPGLDLEEAAGLQISYLSAWHLLHSMARVREGENVLIHSAAGGVGAAVIQLANLADLSLAGVVESSTQAGFALEMGLEAAIDIRTDTVAARMNELTDGRGFDLIIGPASSMERLEADMEMLAPFGRLMLWDPAGGAGGHPVHQTPSPAADRSASIGMFSLDSLERRPELWRPSLAELTDLLADELIQPPVVRRLSLDRAAEAHAIVEDKRNVGLTVLVP